jgi:hypothetical protein
MHSAAAMVSNSPVRKLRTYFARYTGTEPAACPTSNFATWHFGVKQSTHAKAMDCAYHFQMQQNEKKD